MKKTTLLKAALGIAGAYVVASGAGVALLSVSAGKRMGEHEDANNMMYSNAIGSKKVIVNPDTDYAYINCINGSTNIFLNELPVHYDMYLNLGSACATYNIKLPEDVRVVIEGIGNKTVVKNKYPETEDESLPTVHIDINHTSFTSVSIAKV